MDIDAADYERFSTKLKAAEKGIASGVKRALNDAAQESGMEAIREGAEVMPSRGGLRDLLASRGRVTVQPRPKGALLALQNRSGVQLAPLDKGHLRHPVFRRERVSRQDAERMLTSALAESGGKLKFGLRRGVSRVRFGAAKWVDQPVPEGSFTRAMEARMDQIRPKVAQAIMDELEKL